MVSDLDTEVAGFESCNDFLVVFRIQPNDYLQRIVDFATEGNNLLIT